MTRVARLRRFWCQLVEIGTSHSAKVEVL